jgi:2-polyprenyl-3-methyl-5-hydroxy-6-metoxy-1,4-benzoquinol methylase
MSNITHSQVQTQCLISGEPVVKILDFGQHSYADTFIREDQLHLSEPVFPLEVWMNPNNGQLQLRYISNASDRYNLYNYSYTSSNSAISRAHWEKYARVVTSHYNTKGLVVEIGSNDGYLLKQFTNPETKVLGIDSSATMTEVANQSGINTINAIFNEQVANDVVTSNGLAAVVIANNVLNHANDPLGFVNGVVKLLHPQGVFVFEVPYWASMVESNRFTDMVYHEHISYFTLRSVNALLQQDGMSIIDAKVVDYHGGSLRVTARPTASTVLPIHVQKMIDAEHELKLWSPETYEKLQNKFIAERDQWLAAFYRIKSEEPTAVIIGVGAAAKANTWLNWHSLNKNNLHCITDASPHKQGKFTPLSRIPIRGDEEFARHESPYALILSWNISEGLRQAILNINPNTRFITQ